MPEFPKTPRGLAAASFVKAKARAHRGYCGPAYVKRTIGLMRNAWAAYHAGAEWMHGCAACPYSDVVSADNMRLRAEVECLRRERDTARRAHVADLKDALADVGAVFFLCRFLDRNSGRPHDVWAMQDIYTAITEQVIEFNSLTREGGEG